MASVDIPDAVIEQAGIALTDAQIAFNDVPANYAQSMGDQEVITVVAPIIAEWAQREALMEAAETFYDDGTGNGVIGWNSFTVARKLRALAEGDN